MDWIDLGPNRDRWWAAVSAVMNFRVPYNAGNLLTGWGPVSFSRRTLLRGVICLVKMVKVKKLEVLNTPLHVNLVVQMGVNLLNRVNKLCDYIKTFAWETFMYLLTNLWLL